MATEKLLALPRLFDIYINLNALILYPSERSNFNQIDLIEIVNRNN